LTRATRYGASPPFYNSFINHVPGKESPMYQPDAERFSTTHNHRVEFQKEQKEKEKKIHNAKIDAIKTHQNFFQEKIREEESNLLEKDTQKRRSKGLAQWSYEHVRFEQYFDYFILKIF
jgi:hypothetical protein